MAEKEWKKTEEEKAWTADDYEAERVWGSLRKELQLDLTGMTDEQLRDVVDDLIASAGPPMTNFGDEGRGLLVEEARKEAGEEIPEKPEELEEVTPEELEAEAGRVPRERRERRVREPSGALEAVGVQRVGRIKGLEVPEVSVAESPGERMRRVVTEVEGGVERRIAETDAGVKEVTGQSQVAVPVSFGQRVADTARNIRNVVVDLSSRVVKRIRDLLS